ncbi:MAG: 4-alpha-glucanotransferase [Bacilli bacterium]|nr:4-alpha-glucanotransferase [Bacilli bacterium]
MKLEQRLAGILMPISALPNPYGVGDFGPEAYRFVDLLAEGHFHLWQILPLNSMGYGHSPYQPFSSFAFDELYVSLSLLEKRGLIEAVPPFHEAQEKVLYEEIRPYKRHFLQLAFEKEMEKDPDCLNKFMEAKPWVKDYGVFLTFKEENYMASWEVWPEEKKAWINDRPELDPEHRKAALFHIWVQKTLFEQWDALHAYANKKGVKIIGDIPFYVGFDSCDVWANQNAFLLDPETKQPLWIAGVPPDYFSATGQRWGNPIYDWDFLQKTDFAFFQGRILGNADIYDIIRLDHFRAFDTYWKIPASCETAIDGAWIEAPGYAFFDSLLAKKNDLAIIAEDLGDMRPEVYDLRDHYEFPGMNVIEFTFEDAEFVKKPGWNKKNMVAYLGTHDNDTMAHFFEELPEEGKKRWLSALDALNLPQGKPVDRMIHYAMSRECDYVVLSLQDILGLGAEGRINVPGIIEDVNWTWRLPSYEKFAEKIPYLAELNKEYRRG